jgi:hypothetical protein
MGKAGAFKEGGEVRMAKGGIASGLSSYELEPMSRKLSDQQLQMKLQDMETDAETKGIMQAESDRRSYARKNMAGGGAIAFAGGDSVKNPFKDEEEKLEGMFPLAKGAAEGKNPVEKEKTRGISKESKSGAAPTPKPTKGETATQATTKVDPDIQESMGVMAPFIAERRQVTPAEEALAKVASQKELTPTEAVQQEREARKAAGADPEMFKRMRGEKQGLLDQATTDAEKQKYLRQAQAWAMFASTPGPLLVAGMKSVMKLADETIEDDKELRKVKSEIMKSMHEIDLAEYNENAGLAEKGMKRRETAFGHMLEANKYLTTAQSQRAHDISSLAAKGLETGTQVKRQRMADIADIKQAGIAASARGEGSDDKSAERQTERARAELIKWDNSEKGKALAQAESILANPNLKGDSRKIHEANRDRLKAERDGVMREIKDSYPKARLQEPTTPAPTYSAEDIAFTAKKHGISEEEVKKRLGIK